MKSIHPRVAFRSTLLLAATLVAGGLLAQPAFAEPGKGRGKGKGGSPDFVPPGQVGKDLPPGLRRAPVEVIVKKVPPALRVEVMPARPSVKHVWVSGHWMWANDAYMWTPGLWMLPPEPAAVWVAPRFENRSGVSVSISGYWKL